MGWGNKEAGNYSALQQGPLLGKSLMEMSALAVSKEVGKGLKVKVTFELILFFPSIFHLLCWH